MKAVEKATEWLKNMSVYTNGINATLLHQYPTLNPRWLQDAVYIYKTIYVYIHLFMFIYAVFT